MDKDLTGFIFGTFLNLYLHFSDIRFMLYAMNKGVPKFFFWNAFLFIIMR